MTHVGLYILLQCTVTCNVTVLCTVDRFHLYRGCKYSPGKAETSVGNSVTDI